jgi:Ca2+-binding RTX toxin-like protein
MGQLDTDRPDLDGTNGNDTINGLAGNDILNGKNGNDRLNGGPGNKVLVGWKRPGHPHGRDRINLKAIDANTGWPLGNQDFKPSQLIYEKVNGNGLLTVNVYDGDDLQIIAAKR